MAEPSVLWVRFPPRQPTLWNEQRKLNFGLADASSVLRRRVNGTLGLGWTGSVLASGAMIVAEWCHGVQPVSVTLGLAVLTGEPVCVLKITGWLLPNKWYSFNRRECVVTDCARSFPFNSWISRHQFNLWNSWSLVQPTERRGKGSAILPTISLLIRM